MPTDFVVVERIATPLRSFRATTVLQHRTPFVSAPCLPPNQCLTLVLCCRHQLLLVRVAQWPGRFCLPAPTLRTRTTAPGCSTPVRHARSHGSTTVRRPF